MTAEEIKEMQVRLFHSFSYPWDCSGYWITTPEEMFEWKFGDKSKLAKTEDILHPWKAIWNKLFKKPSE